MSNELVEKKATNYLSSEEFFTEIINSRIDGKISDRLSEMFILLSERCANHRNFVRYLHFRKDIIATGQLACVYGFRKFRPFKDKQQSIEWENNKVPIQYDYMTCNNSHAFFTTCIMNALIQFIKAEYNQTNIVNKGRMEEGLDPSYGYADMLKDQEDAVKVKDASDHERLDSEPVDYYNDSRDRDDYY